MSTTIGWKALEFFNAKNTPVWMREAARMFAQKPALADEDLDRLVQIITSDDFDSIEVARLMPEELPDHSGTQDFIRLESIKHQRGIGALYEMQTLTFGETGLTLVFGNNGCGKSSFARILKVASIPRKAKVSDYILANAFTPEDETEPKPEPDAVISFVDGKGNEGQWNLRDEPSSKLTSVRFYDSELAQNYINQPTEISYQPAIIRIMRKVAQIADDLKAKINELADEEFNEARLDDKIYEHVTIGDFLDSQIDIGHDSLQQSISFGQPEEERLHQIYAHISELNKQSTVDQQKAIASTIDQLKTLRRSVQHLDDFVSEERVDKLTSLKNTYSENSAKSKRIRDALQGEEGTFEHLGAEEWKAMWMAARKFAQLELKDPSGNFFAGEDAHCILCAQPLTPEAKERLSLFDQHVVNDAEQKATQAQDAIDEAISEIDKKCDELLLISDKVIQLGETCGLTFVGEFSKELSGIRTYLESQIEFLKGADSVRIMSLTKNPLTEMLDEFIRSEDARLASLENGELTAELKELIKEKDELELRQRCSTHSTQILEAAKHVSESERIRAHESQINTWLLTNTTNNIVDQSLDDQVSSTFDKISRELGVVNTASLTTVRGTRKRSFSLQPVLVSSSNETQLSKVLSEGEQTALGLAGFLTEALLGENLNPIVFDDPVTSMDARRRRAVAHYLLELAMDRQVVVFTHDASFVGDLLQESDYLRTRITERSVNRMDDRPGLVLDHLPWNLSGTRSRINALREDLARIKKAFKSKPEYKYGQDEVRKFAEELSQLWERSVRENLQDPLIDYKMLSVRPSNVRTSVHFTREDYLEFNKGYGFTSKYCRHDASDMYNPPIPHPDELEKELDRLATWHKRVSQYKSTVVDFDD